MSDATDQTPNDLPAPLSHDCGVYKFHCLFRDPSTKEVKAELHCWYFPDNKRGERLVPVKPLKRSERAFLAGLEMSLHNIEDIQWRNEYSNWYAEKYGKFPPDWTTKRLRERYEKKV